jgi:hypothetical protein
MKLTGRSLSNCVNDIASGAVNYADVTKIVARTAAPDKETFDKVIANYQRSAWVKHPDAAADVARRLWEDGKIDQPRLRNADPVDQHDIHSIEEGHWVEDDTGSAFNPAEFAERRAELEKRRIDHYFSDVFGIRAHP